MEQDLAKLIQALSERLQASELQLKELREVVKALEFRIADLAQTAASKSETAPAASKAAQPATKESRKAEVTPEILVMLAAAATAYLGKKVRIRSAKMLQSPYEIINPWAQQGRVFIQASHNQHLRLR
jgi:septal ring factor EnvC (AmiA/AmiB activator)